MDEGKKQEVAEQPKGGALQVIDYGEDVGAGMENVQREEFKIPLLRILQTNSPQCKPPSAGGLSGAKAGMIFNTATGEMYPEAGFVFVPCFRNHDYVEYIDREAGGGFVGIHADNEPVIETLRKEQGRFGKLRTASGNQLVENYYLFGLPLIDEFTVLQAVVPFSSTQIPKYQAFMTRYQSITYPNSSGKRVCPPLWAHRWHLSTTFQKHKKGDFFGWNLRLVKEPPIESRMRLDDPIYVQGRAFYDLLKEGRAKADMTTDAKAGTDEEIPF